MEALVVVFRVLVRYGHVDDSDFAGLVPVGVDATESMPAARQDPAREAAT
jgi:hypothetical protein